MDERKQNIVLHLNCHEQRLTIPCSREPMYRRAEDIINQTYDKFRKYFPNKSEEELWRLTVLEIAIALCSDVREKDVTPVQTQLAEISAKIEEVLGK